MCIAVPHTHTPDYTSFLFYFNVSIFYVAWQPQTACSYDSEFNYLVEELFIVIVVCISVMATLHVFGLVMDMTVLIYLVLAE